MSTSTQSFNPRFFEQDPLFWPIAPAARAFADLTEWPRVEEYGARLGERVPVAFREQPPKPRRRRRGAVTARELYDGRITTEGWVPTRPGSWHDFLNMLVWASFPEQKRQIHARLHRAQSAWISGAVTALPNARTREQDALALMDEGGVIVVCEGGREGSMRAALASRDAPAARALLERGEARAVIFGHALYESLVLGQLGVWGAGLVAPALAELAEPAAIVAAAGAALTAALAREGSFLSPAELVRVDLDLVRCGSIF